MKDKMMETATAEMDSWQMATSVLIGIWQAIDKAQKEHAAILAEHYGKPFAPEASRVSATIETLMEAEQTLHTELRRTARSSGLPFPEKMHG